MNKILFFICLLEIVLGLPAEQLIEWNPRNLYGYAINPQYSFYLNPYNTQFKLIDPQNYLNNADKNKMMRMMANIENRQIIPIFCVLEALEYPYKQDIRKFSEEFAELLFSFNKYYEDRIMLICFSMKDRLMHITTGKFTRRIFSDNDCKIFLNMVKPYMRSGDYFNGFYKMMERIYRKILDKKHKNENSNTNTINRNDNTFKQQNNNINSNTFKQQSNNKNKDSSNSSDFLGVLAVILIVIVGIVSCICCGNKNKSSNNKKEDNINTNPNKEESERIKKEKELEREKERERQKQEKESKFGGASSSW